MSDRNWDFFGNAKEVGIFAILISSQIQLLLFYRLSISGRSPSSKRLDSIRWRNLQ